jgi:hypothetical protein
MVSESLLEKSVVVYRWSTGTTGLYNASARSKLGRRKGAATAVVRGPAASERRSGDSGGGLAIEP